MLNDSDWPNTESVLLSPTYAKDYSSDPVLGNVWDAIVESVKDADDVTVVGYSLPPGDISARSMLGYAFRKNTRCKKVMLVDPSGVHGSHWPDFLRQFGIDMEREYHTLQEWTQAGCGR